MKAEKKAGRLLLKKHRTVACAESLTGGLVSYRLTSVPGSSEYIHGGVVSYTAEMKHEVLGVPQTTLDHYGAVSAETAKAMAENVRQLMQADYGISTTGNAGPSPSEGKSVGLVYTALADSKGVFVQEHRFTGSRSGVRDQAADAALSLLVAALKQDDGDAALPVQGRDEARMEDTKD